MQESQSTMDNGSSCREEHVGVSVAPTAAASATAQEDPQAQQQELFDLSLIQQKRQEQQQQQQGENANITLPPMESLTMYYTTDDDNTSVSSVSTQGSQQRRSMFSQYWKKTGQEPPRFLPRSSPCGVAAAANAAAATPPPLSASSPSNNGSEDDMPHAMAGRGVLATPPEHEAVLDIQVPSMTAVASSSVVSRSSSSRRSMFPRGNASGTSGYSTSSSIRQSSSAPSLTTYNEQEEEGVASAVPSDTAPRKIRSYSQLLTKQPSSSCLRESRFSPNKSGAALRRTSTCTSATDSSSSVMSAAGSSVRFDKEVTVLHFDVPQERFAHEGWSDYFQ